MAARNNRFVILDKFFKGTISRETPMMFWRLFDGSSTIVRKVNMNNGLYFSLCFCQTRLLGTNGESVELCGREYA